MNIKNIFIFTLLILLSKIVYSEFSTTQLQRVESSSQIKEIKQKQVKGISRKISSITKKESKSSNKVPVFNPIKYDHVLVSSSFENSELNSSLDVLQIGQNEYEITLKWKTENAIILEFSKKITIFENQFWTETIVQDKQLFPIYISLQKSNNTNLILASVYFNNDSIRESINFQSSIIETSSIAISNHETIDAIEQEKALYKKEEEARLAEEEQLMNIDDENSGKDSDYYSSNVE